MKTGTKMKDAYNLRRHSMAKEGDAIASSWRDTIMAKCIEGDAKFAATIGARRFEDDAHQAALSLYSTSPKALPTYR